jgi:hypothetical protein
MGSDLSPSVTLDEPALAMYLQAHETGSHAGEGMAKRLLGRDDLDGDAKAFLRTFIVEVRVERAHIVSLLDRIGRDQSLAHRALRAAAVGAEMAGRIGTVGSPKPFTDLEALAIGVWGKRLLWGALIELSEADERVASLPLSDLSDQAERQEVELLRLRSESIRSSLTDRPS